MTPESLGPYRILGQIGQGPVGVVFLAATPDGYRLTLKAMHALDASQRDTLRQNDILNRQLAHSHIIAWLAADFDHDPPYIVMPYLAGGSLADRLQNGPVPAAVAITWLRHVAISLDHAHFRGLTHGAVKPTNVLFDAAGVPYLSDFGFGELAVPAPPVLAFSARQQADVRALGGLAFWALTGQAPTTPLPPATTRNPALPAAVDEVLARFDRAQEPLLALIRALSDALALPFPPLVRNTLGQAICLVGRDEELRHLQAAYRAVYAQAGLQVVLITGEDGVGKTRLVDELMNWVIDRPEISRYIHTHMRPNNPPYSLLREVVYFRLSHLPRVDPRPIADRLEWMVANLLGEQPGPHHQETAHIIGQLAGFNVQASPYVKPLLADPQELARRGQQLFLRWVTAASHKEPVILVVDDAHLADAASQQVLHVLASTRQRDDILLILTSRPGHYERRAEWHGLLQHLPLRPLSPEHIEQLIEKTLGETVPLPPTLTNLMAHYTEGNPALTVQWLQRLTEAGILTTTALGHWQVNETRLPEARLSLTDLLNERLRALSEAERAALRRAAILGALASLEGIAALDAVDAVQAEWPLVVQALVVRNCLRPQTAQTFGFVPALLAETVYASIPPDLCRAYHATVAAWLVTQPHIPPRTLAHHFAAAGQLVEAATCLARAAETAWQVSAYQEALADATQGLAWLTDQPEDDLALQLRLQQAEANYQLGHYTAAQASLEAMLPRPLNATQRVAAQTLLAANQRRQGNNQLAYDHLSVLVAQDMTTVAVPIRLRALTELASTCWRLGHLDEATQHYEAALDLAEQHHEAHWITQSLLGLGIVYGLKKQYATSQHYLRQAYARATAHGNRRQALLALNNLGVLSTILQQTAQSLSYTQKALELAQEIDAPIDIAMTLSNLAEIYLAQDKPETARPIIHQAMHLAQTIGSVPWQMSTLLRYADWLQAYQHLPKALAAWQFVQAHPAADHDQREQAAQRQHAHPQAAPMPTPPTSLDDWVTLALHDTESAG